MYTMQTGASSGEYVMQGQAMQVPLTQSIMLTLQKHKADTTDYCQKLDAGYRDVLVLDVKWAAHQICSTGSSQEGRPGGHKEHEANVGHLHSNGRTDHEQQALQCASMRGRLVSVHLVYGGNPAAAQGHSHCLQINGTHL